MDGGETEKGSRGFARYRVVIDKFKENTSAHGIPHVKNAEGACKIVYWLLLSLTSVGFLFWNSSLLIGRFAQFNTTTSVTINSAKTLTFPAVTFCNHNSFKKSKLSGSSTKIDALLASEPDAFNTTWERQNWQYSIINSIIDLSPTARAESGHKLDEMINSCYYNYNYCNYTWDFDSFFDPSYGDCYSYNWGRRGQTLQASTKPGLSYGLSVIFNIEQDEYIGYNAASAGLRVLVHPQDKMPFPSDEGVSASPGETTNIGIKKTSVIRLGRKGLFKYGDCVAEKQNELIDVFTEHHNTAYTKKTCETTCLQKQFIERCSCASTSYPMYGKAFGSTANTTAAICTSENATMLDCEVKTWDLFSSNELGCDCENPCSEELLTVSQSTARFPSDDYWDSIYDYLYLSPAILSMKNDSAKFRKNIGQINVFFEEFNFMEIKESEAYELFSLISDMGGILGLFIGFSMLTIFEFFEFAFDLLAVMIVGLMGKRTPRVTQVENVENLPPGYGNDKQKTILDANNA